MTQAKPSRKTSRRVIWTDRFARALITLGGAGAIVAVLLVGVYLAWVVVPMFDSARVARVDAGAPSQWPDAAPLHVAIDEYLTMGWAFLEDGSVHVFRYDDATTMRRAALFPDLGGRTLTAHSFQLRGGEAAFAFSDGAIRLGRIGFETDFLDDDDADPALEGMAPGDTARLGDALVTRTNEGQFRRQRVAIDLGEEVALSSGAPITLIDISFRPAGPVVCAMTDDGLLMIKAITSRKNLMTGRVTTSFVGGELRLDDVQQRGAPMRLLLSGTADNAFIAWADGHLLRVDLRDLNAPRVAERIELVGAPGAMLTALDFLIGKTSLVSGDSLGAVRVWFRIKPEDAPTSDGAVLVNSRSFLAGSSPVISLAASMRTRLLAAGYADGDASLFHVTAGRELAHISTPGGAPARALAIAPRDNAFASVSGAGLHRWSIDGRHPSITLRSIFTPVWYEGYSGPQHVWQSSSGTDDFEPKLGLAPLIFGTIKATVYSMMFGVPLAILAAVYTSEFLHPRVRARVKPTIEMMASLPSVVLGFLAALVIAPFIEGIVPQTVSAFFTIPIVFLLGAYAWQMLPPSLSQTLMRYRLLAMMAVLPIGIGAALLVGPVAEAALFAGDIKGWLDGRVGGAAGGWFLVLFPLSALAVAIVHGRVAKPRIRAAASVWSRAKLARTDALVFVAGLALAVLLALGLSHAVAGVGADARGLYLGTYVQRNAMVVGFVMGFAIIPIIYTIAEDALSAVPDHLRSASLGAGATQWQTAVRIIIPTAMSGIFSAVMIGFGRAVGETMIVLMAAGNTPVMEWNIFNGFRTLSANIAVELPEAVQNSTHYRMLFLAALTLFVMTFAVNTVAEIVRQRFRKRAFQL